MHSSARMISAPDGLSILRFVPNFLPGVIAFALPRVARVSSSLWPVFIVGLVVVFTLNPVLPVGWILCLILGLCIPYFGEMTAPWLRLVSNRIATYSYGIYLSHQFAIWIALGLLASHSVWVRPAAADRTAHWLPYSSLPCD